MGKPIHMDQTEITEALLH